MLKYYSHLLALLVGGLLLSAPSYGQGFPATPVLWNLPAGGRLSSTGTTGFFAPGYGGNFYTDVDGSQQWVILDINGDARLDLVVTSAMQNGDIAPYSAATAPFWQVYLNTGTAFSATATAWALPAGGHRSNAGTNSFFSTAYQGFPDDVDGSQQWSMFDINGDARPDLVVTSERQNGQFAPYSSAAGASWQVYLNTGTGFASTAIAWALPGGGRLSSVVSSGSSNTGFYKTGYSAFSPIDGDGSQQWALLDINGDARPDLVVTSEQQNGQYTAFGTAAGAAWRVYLNTGTGFALSAATWALPTGGRQTSAGPLSFPLTTYNGYYTNDSNGSQQWALLDINGDTRPDLVITSEQQNGQFSPYANATWHVYLNTGTGFSPSAATWALPTGGGRQTSAGATSYYMPNYSGSIDTDGNGSQQWSVFDITGDTRPDLVITSELQNGVYAPYGSAASATWRVYPNTGTGFAPTAISWTLPTGGQVTSTGPTSFYTTAYFGGLDDVDGSQIWAVADINGDTQADLIVSSEHRNGDFFPYGSAANSVWHVYLQATRPTATHPATASPLQLFPNPTTAQLHLTGLTPGPTTYTVLDALGRLVQAGSLHNAMLDVRALPAGVYALRLSQAAGESRTVRFVKQ